MTINKQVLTGSFIMSVLVTMLSILTIKRTIANESDIFVFLIITLVNTVAFYGLWFIKQIDSCRPKVVGTYAIFAVSVIVCIICAALDAINIIEAVTVITGLPVITVYLYGMVRVFGCFTAQGKTDESLMNDDEKKAFKLLKENRTSFKAEFFILLAAGLVNLMVGWQKGKTYQNYPTLFKATFFIITLGFGLLWHVAVEAALQNPDKIGKAAIEVLGDD